MDSHAPATKQPPTVRALLLTLGYDPEEHVLYRTEQGRGAFLWSGFKIETKDGMPVRFITRKTLRKLELTDEGFRRELAAHVEMEQAIDARQDAAE